MSRPAVRTGRPGPGRPPLSVEPPPGERAPGYDVTEREERMAAEGYELSAEVSADLFQDYEARFEEGSRTVVAGIEATLAPAGSR
ncbi:hypothetical protein ACFYOY_17725 [Streptomyces sp. NPDC007875]|uniref:hypothetical protein n=1 Tax=Streptomyces sp. NPDC007875 TaxID=3364783 RepID=UPI0036A315B5